MYRIYYMRNDRDSPGRFARSRLIPATEYIIDISDTYPTSPLESQRSVSEPIASQWHAVESKLVYETQKKKKKSQINSIGWRGWGNWSYLSERIYKGY